MLPGKTLRDRMSATQLRITMGQIQAATNAQEEQVCEHRAFIHDPTSAPTPLPLPQALAEQLLAATPTSSVASDEDFFDVAPGMQGFADSSGISGSSVRGGFACRLAFSLTHSQMPMCSHPQTAACPWPFHQQTPPQSLQVLSLTKSPFQ